MNRTLRFLSSVTALTIFFVLSSMSGIAQPRHPAYLRALSDLRLARAHLQRPNQGILGAEEREAIHEIDAAIGEIKKAAIDDGKDLSDHAQVDVGLDWGGRLRHAYELTGRARNDIAREEDNLFAQGLQQRALMHIDRSRARIADAIHIVEAR